jgi:glycosyltransferase involved in cell wall biosynthesis
MSSIDVVIPCYNYGRYLKACIESVLSEKALDVTVLVIDDCSSDETPEICRAFAASDQRVSFIRHARNIGHIATYNEGIARAKADYFLLLSADDLITPGALGRAASLLDRNPSVGLVYGYAMPLYGREARPVRSDDAGWTTWPGADWVGHVCRSGRNFIISPEAVMRTCVLHRLGGYNPSLPHSGDMEIWLRAAAISDVGRINGADQAWYRVHAANMHSTVHAGRLFDLESRRDAILSAFGREAGSLAGAPGFQESARRALALEAIRFAAYAIDSGRGEPLIAYMDFARALWPQILLTRDWRNLGRRVRARNSRLSRLGLLRARLAEIGDKLAWRRWWRTGLY